MDEPRTALSYEELLEENEQLKAHLDKNSRRLSAPRSQYGDDFTLDNTLEDFEKHLFESLTIARQTSSVTSEADVEFPSRQFSNFLLAKGRNTTSWSHFAIHHPTFEVEHHIFWETCSNSRQRAMYEPFWLSVYFSFLSVSLQ